VLGVIGRIPWDFDHADAGRRFWFAAWDAPPHLFRGVSGSDFLSYFFWVGGWVSDLAGGDAIRLKLFGYVSGVFYDFAAFLLGFA
jgi:hypothetical protein